MTRNLIAAAALATVAFASAAEARDQIKIVGSSTVFPYTQAVAEAFSRETRRPAPVVESTGTGGGMKIFCRGVGTDQADITGASRAMKKGEFADCQKNGVKSITEVLIGYDGISMALSRKGKDMDITKKQLFQALAAEVPVKGKIVANPYRKWSDIDPSLPNEEIRVYGPPPTSGTRDAWVELVMDEGCAQFPEIKKLSKDAHKRVCQRMRTDGPFIEAGENDNLIVQRLNADPVAFGIFGYSFLYENQDKLKAVKIEGVAPTTEAIVDSSYQVSRPLYFYIKNAHRNAIPGLDEFVKEYVSERAMGEGGYLSERGLIPLSADKRKATRDAVANSKNLSM